jgi:hypothetical protein
VLASFLTILREKVENSKLYFERREKCIRCRRKSGLEVETFFEREEHEPSSILSTFKKENKSSPSFLPSIRPPQNAKTWSCTKNKIEPRTTMNLTEVQRKEKKKKFCRKKFKSNLTKISLYTNLMILFLLHPATIQSSESGEAREAQIYLKALSFLISFKFCSIKISC